MNPLPAILIVAFFIWLAWDIVHTPVTEDREQDLDESERFYHDGYDN